MIFASIGVCVLGLVMAWVALRQNGQLKERIAQVNSRVYHLRRQMHEAQEKNDQELKHLKFEVMKLRGNLSVTPEMRVGDILMLHPQAQQILAGFHLGGCSSCSVDDHQSLAEAAAVNGRELDPILTALNGLVTEGQDGDIISVDRLKTPNVQLEF